MPAQRHARESRQQAPASTPAAAATAPRPGTAALPATPAPGATHPATRGDGLARTLAAAVGRRAAVASVQRKVKIGKGGWLASTQLPPVPPDVAKLYHPKVVKAGQDLAAQWCGDKVQQNRTFTNDAAFYRAVFNQAETAYTPTAVRVGGRALGQAVLRDLAERDGARASLVLAQREPWAAEHGVADLRRSDLRHAARLHGRKVPRRAP